MPKTLKSNKEIKEQLREFLMSSKNTITIEEARKRVNKKWSK